MKNHVDVVVVGAGPVGLLAAIELTLGGAHVLVLERLASPSMVTKALGIGPLGIEALQRRGMTAAIAAAEERIFTTMNKFAEGGGTEASGRGPKVSGHFAGLSLIRKETQKEPERRAHPVDQQAVEAMLNDRAFSLGIEIRRECEVTNFVQYDHSVDVEWMSSAGINRIHCSYLVACDGGRSSIRKMAGFAFPGTPPSMTMYNTVVQVDRPQLLSRGWRRTSGGVFSYGFLPNRLVMLDFSGPPNDRDAPVTRLEVEAVLRRVSGEDVRIEALESGSRWTDNTRLVDTYRKRRVFLAGDAAHVHPPFGGQGLSLGLVDAANIGWKLAAVIRDQMSENLVDAYLDTYTAERRPVAEAVLANTLAQMAIMRPDAQSGAMRDIVANLMQFDDVNRFFGEMMTGLNIRYDLGSQQVGCVQDSVGRLIGDKPIIDGDAGLSLYQLMQDGMGVFLDASPEGKTSQFVAARSQRIHCVPTDSGPSMLIRPDACIAWVGEENNTDGLEEALCLWFHPTLKVRPVG